jgi:hypothetical protein
MLFGVAMVVVSLHTGNHCDPFRGQHMSGGCWVSVSTHILAQGSIALGVVLLILGVVFHAQRGRR